VRIQTSDEGDLIAEKEEKIELEGEIIESLRNPCSGSGSTTATETGFELTPPGG
jgi:hypothetical protein